MYDGRERRSRRLRRALFPRPLAPMDLFVAAFLFLLGATAALALAQFIPNPNTPWLAIGYAGAAVVCVFAALGRRPRR